MTSPSVGRAWPTCGRNFTCSVMYWNWISAWIPLICWIAAWGLPPEFCWRPSKASSRKNKLMARQPLFAGLVFDEFGNPAASALVGEEPCYVVDDAGFHRHIPSAQVDRQV